MAIRKITRYVTDNGFALFYEPEEKSLVIKATDSGWEARYVTQDPSPTRPDEFEDSVFLVHYHRDFRVARDKVITENDVRSFYRKERIDQEEQYFIFRLAAYIHSGVRLFLGTGDCVLDPGGWDTSHVGLVLVRKDEAGDEAAAQKLARGCVDEWNQYLSGDVWGIVCEVFDSEKKQIKLEDVWGYYGYEAAVGALQSEL